MSGQQPWDNLTVPLNDLAAVFGGELADLQLHEEPDKVQSYVTLPAQKAEQAFPKADPDKTGKLKRLAEVLEALKAKYPNSVVLWIKSGEFNVLSLDTYAEDDLEDLYKKVLGRVPLLLDLTIDKKELLKQWGLGAPHSVIKFYFSPGALADALSGPPSELAGDRRSLLHGFNGENKLIILAPAHERGLELNGEYLTVLGGKAVARWQEYPPAQKPERARVVLDSIRDAFDKKPRSSDINLRDLTPLQLLLDWTGHEQAAPGPPANDPIARALFAQLIVYSLLFIANSAEVEKREGADEDDEYPWKFTFKQDKYQIRINVNGVDEIGQALTAQGIVNPLEAAQTLGHLAIWAYSEERALDNRLIVIQVVVGSSLQDNNPADNLKELIRRASDVDERVHQRWGAFMEEKLQTFLGQIKELEQIVDTTTKTYNEQIEGLTKTLTENILAAVGVLVGTFIAAIFTSPFKVWIFLVGAGTYLAYLILFPIKVGLTSAWQRFKVSRSVFLNRRAVFIKRLSEEDVSEIVKDSVRSAERRYVYWFLETKRRYWWVVKAIVAIMIVAAGLGIWQAMSDRQNNLTVNGVFYSGAPTSDFVPMMIQGNNFGKDKEIVITIGNSGLINAQNETLKLHGSTALTFSARQEDLAQARESGNAFVLVRQGSAEPQKIPLPNGPAPIPHPVFEKWNRLTGEIVEANGLDFDSISTIETGGTRLNFKVLDHGRTLRLSGPVQLGDLTGKPLEVRLKNGERQQESVFVSVQSPAAR